MTNAEQVDFSNLSDDKHVFIVVIATKPDIIKQAPFYNELKRVGKNVLLVHTGQHYDFNLSGGMLEEFGMTVDKNLGISGDLCQKTAQMIERFGAFLDEVKAAGKNPIPIVHGDTTTASATANASFAKGYFVVHNEAGIRTLTPKFEHIKNLVDTQNVDSWFDLMLDQNNFERGSVEPTPEQFNTRSIEAAAGVYLASHAVTKEFLINEGCAEERISVVGNCVVDIVRQSIESASDSKIFEKYPMLESGFIRFCIHRRENCQSEKRFVAIFESMEKTVNAGHKVLLISLFATEKAIDDFGLRERLETLKQKENFLYSEVWPYYSDVVAAMMKATVCVTDSGSMQEEMNEMGIPCVTLRFGTDRPETLFAGGNVLAPPCSADVIYKIVEKVIAENLLKNTKKIYGDNPSEEGVAAISKILEEMGTISYTEDERILKRLG